MVILISSLLFVPELHAKDMIYFIRGNIIDRHSTAHFKAEKILSNFIHENYPGVIFKDIHNQNWESACPFIRREKMQDPYGKIILIGHSWGAQVSMSIARCLKRSANLNVDALISIDPVKKPFHVHVSFVPTSIDFAISFRQNRDKFLRGHPKLKWSGPNAELKTPIENIYVPLSTSYNAHDMIFYQLISDNIIQNYLTQWL